MNNGKYTARLYYDAIYYYWQVDATSMFLSGRQGDLRAPSQWSVWDKRAGRAASRSELKLEQSLAKRRQLDKLDEHGTGGSNVGAVSVGEQWAANQNLAGASGRANESETTATKTNTVTTTTTTFRAKTIGHGGGTGAAPAGMINGTRREAPEVEAASDSSELDQYPQDRRVSGADGTSNHIRHDDIMNARRQPPLERAGETIFPSTREPLVRIGRQLASLDGSGGPARAGSEAGAELIDKDSSSSGTKSGSPSAAGGPGPSLFREYIPGGGDLNLGSHDAGDRLPAQGQGQGLAQGQGRERLAQGSARDELSTAGVSRGTLELLHEQFGRSEADESDRLLAHALKCRVEKDYYLDFEEYRHYTCANCYK